MNGIILAGGFGKRLMPLTAAMPKPMLKVANNPMISYSISNLASQVKDITMTLAYMPEKIIEWTRGYSGIDFHYNIESSPLGTYGGVKAAANYLDDVFVVASGDGISDVDIGAMYKFHIQSGADVTIAAVRVDQPSLYGIIDCDSDGRIRKFVEKPQGMSGIAWASSGIYIINKYVLDFLKDEKGDFAKDLFPIVLSIGKMYAYRHYGYFSDMGSYERYFKGNFELFNMNMPLKNNKLAIVSNVDKSTNSLISNTSSIVGNICECIIGNDCRIASGANLRRCIVEDGVTVMKSHIGCIIGKDYVIDIKDYLLNDVSYFDALFA